MYHACSTGSTAQRQKQGAAIHRDERKKRLVADEELRSNCHLVTQAAREGRPCEEVPHCLYARVRIHAAVPIEELLIDRQQPLHLPTRPSVVSRDCTVAGREIGKRTLLLLCCTCTLPSLKLLPVFSTGRVLRGVLPRSKRGLSLLTAEGSSGGREYVRRICATPSAAAKPPNKFSSCSSTGVPGSTAGTGDSASAVV